MSGDLTGVAPAIAAQDVPMAFGKWAANTVFTIADITALALWMAERPRAAGAAVAAARSEPFDYRHLAGKVGRPPQGHPPLVSRTLAGLGLRPRRTWRQS